jgi:hypothetical protein
MLSPHFSEAELRYDETPPVYQGNVRRLAYLLEEFRRIAGVPLRVTSVWRSPERNAAVGGVPTSRHLTGEAVDFVPVGLPVLEFWQRVVTARNAGAAPAWGELELDTTDGHVHVTLARFGERNGEVFILDRNGTRVLERGTVAFVGGGILLVALLAWGLWRLTH